MTFQEMKELLAAADDSVLHDFSITAYEDSETFDLERYTPQGENWIFSIDPADGDTLTQIFTGKSAREPHGVSRGSSQAGEQKPHRREEKKRLGDGGVSA